MVTADPSLFSGVFMVSIALILVLLIGISFVVGWELPGTTIRRPAVMGILNLTPDSFSDGGRFNDIEVATARAAELEALGADVIDLGGESSRPGAKSVPLDEEIRRVIPVIEQITDQLKIPISVDTMKPELASRAIQLGASIINDIRGLEDDRMVEVVANADVGVVLMHIKGTPMTMQNNPSYDNVCDEVFTYLDQRISRAESAGIRRSRIAIDPGIGFGKSSSHNLALLQSIDRLRTFGCPILIGTSRKRFLWGLTQREVEDRLVGSVVSSLASLVGGADIVRVHDVGGMVDAITVWRAIRGID